MRTGPRRRASSHRCSNGACAESFPSCRPSSRPRRCPVIWNSRRRPFRLVCPTPTGAAAGRRAGAIAWRFVGLSPSRFLMTCEHSAILIDRAIHSSITQPKARNPPSYSTRTLVVATAETEISMSKLARSITKDELAAFKVAGVVLLRGILDLSAVNTLRRCIDEAVNTLGQSPSGYDMSALTKAFESNDCQQLDASSDGQHNVKDIVAYMKSTGKPLLFDVEKVGKGSFLLDFM